MLSRKVKSNKRNSMFRGIIAKENMFKPILARGNKNIIIKGGSLEKESQICSQKEIYTKL